MRLPTVSILVITFTIYVSQVENAAVPLVDPNTTIENGDRAAPIDPSTAIADGVELSKEIMETLKAAIESSTVMKAIHSQIEKIQLVNDYLDAEEIKKVTDAKVNLQKAENEFSMLRIELSTMAEHTKLTTAKLIKYTNYLSEDDTGRFDKQFGLIFTKFVNLMKITSTRLGEAKKRYDKMSAELAETKGELTAFKDIAIQAADENSAKYKKYADKVRLEAYGGSAACVAAGPFAFIVCPLIYAAAAAAIESKLKDYKHQVTELKENSETVVTNLEDILLKIDDKDKQLKQEVTLINKWELLAMQAKDDYGNTPIAEAIETIPIFKEMFIGDFQALYDAADAFNKWILTKEA